MKFYVLDGCINGRAIKGKKFFSRSSAEIGLGKILTKHDLQVEDDRFPAKHTEEFVCDDYTRFSISRVVVD